MSRHFILACALTLATAGAAFAQSAMGSNTMAPATNTMAPASNSMAPGQTSDTMKPDSMKPDSMKPDTMKPGTMGPASASGMNNNTMAPAQ
jgi:pentapeptide MXKDX repeat protein